MEMTLALRAVRVISFSMFVSIFVGLTVSYVILTGGTLAEPFMNVFSVGAISSMPVSIPMGLFGGYLAFRVLEKERGDRHLASWLARGSAWGSMLGSLGTALWFTSFNLTSINFRNTDSLTGYGFILLVTIPIGAVSGVIVGSIVAVYCYRISASRVKN
jgi:hypothetical protein